MAYREFQVQRANSVDLDEVAQYETPHQDLRCLQIKLISSLVLKELIQTLGYKSLKLKVS